MTETLAALSDVFTLTFVVASMLALGFSLTVRQIVSPLRDGQLVIRALLANFVLVPVAAYVIKTVIPIGESFGIGLVLLATAAGAPFLPKLVQLARGDVAFAVGLMVLLMVTTVAYLPLALPLLLPGVSINPLDIASSLVVLMLLPLGVALAIRARYAEVAAQAQPVFAQIANVGLMGVMATMLLLNWRALLTTVGTGAILAALLFVAAAFVFGYVLGPASSTKPVLGLGTAQRNIAAAMVVATGNFAADPNVLVMVLVGSVLMMVLLMPGAGELGKRRAPAEPVPTAAAAPSDSTRRVAPEQPTP
jgi:BASS family bile acid:Na+ symporter